mmetsp:Transcript_29050/g.93080  ORF Transcript_29050/g.93080 Transcript_29050/m.93080 type:complete len:228 (-) Transcript_29050:407-1090(-)
MDGQALLRVQEVGQEGRDDAPRDAAGHALQQQQPHRRYPKQVAPAGWRRRRARLVRAARGGCGGVRLLVVRATVPAAEAVKEAIALLMDESRTRLGETFRFRVRGCTLSPGPLLLARGPVAAAHAYSRVSRCTGGVHAVPAAPPGCGAWRMGLRGLAPAPAAAAARSQRGAASARRPARRERASRAAAPASRRGADPSCHRDSSPGRAFPTGTPARSARRCRQRESM